MVPIMLSHNNLKMGKFQKNMKKSEANDSKSDSD